MALRLAVLLLVIFGGVPAHRPSLPSLPALSARHGDALVRVIVDAPTSVAQDDVTGFFVGTDGTIATVLADVSEGTRVLVEQADGERLVARVLLTDPESSLVLLKLQRPGPSPFATLQVAPSGARPMPGAWLVALRMDPGANVSPAVGGLLRLGPRAMVLDVPSARGAPILDDRGRVIAITSARASSRRSIALYVGRLHALGAALRARSSEGRAQVRAQPQ